MRTDPRRAMRGDVGTTTKLIPTPVGDLESVKLAARRLHKRREYLMRLIDAGKLQAWRYGGTSAKPLLGVRPGEATEAVANDMRYVPKAKAPRKGARPAVSDELDPSVTC